MAANTSKKPVVKMNLACKLRMERSNPLLFYKKQIELLNASKLLRESEAETNRTINETGKFLPNLCSTANRPSTVNRSTRTYRDNFITGNIATQNKHLKDNTMNKTIRNETKTTVLNSNKSVKNISLLKTSNLTKIEPAKSKNFINKSMVSTNKMLNDTKPKKFSYLKSNQAKVNISEPSKRAVIVKNTQVSADPSKTHLKVTVPAKKPTVVRRSLSAVHFNRIKTTDLNSFKTKPETLANKKKIDIKTPIKEETDFLKRRSISFSSPSNRKSIVSTPIINKTTTSAVELQSRLNDWLEKRGKPVGSFHHLKCFGVHILPRLEEYDDEDKENFEGFEEKNKSYENLKITNDTDEKIDHTNLFSVAKDALYDLHKLILEGYPRESCEVWLQIIRSKFSQLEEQPQYWECRAALEEVRGNFSSAVDCYQKAIIKGAEIKQVDDSLEHLLQKFSVLNLSPEKNCLDTNKKDPKKRKTILDARNVFKSSIINFAIQERSLKTTQKDKDDFKFVATPVRRSTRKSRSVYVSTPGITICSSLKQLDEPTRQSMIFKSNRALPT